MSHKGNSSEEPEATPAKKVETESKTFPIVASISCRAFEFLFFLLPCDELEEDLSLTRNQKYGDYLSVWVC